MFISFHLLSVLQTLLSWDRHLFELINSGTANPFFDVVMPYIRNSVFWAPLYLFLLVFMTSNLKSNAWWWVLFFICTVALTDMVSSRLFKENFERLRPCNDPSFFMHVRLLLDHCAGGYSFTSSHAANHFGMATYFFLTTRRLFKKWASAGFWWAAVICYAQVYVGVHYPFDILGGTIIGMASGALTALFFNKRFGFAIFDKEPTLTV